MQKSMTKIITAITTLILLSCSSSSNMNRFFQAHNNFQEGECLTVSDAEFIDWAYPYEKKLKEHFPGKVKLADLSYKSMKYHGAIFETYIDGKIRKFLVMVPRKNTATVKKIKRLYNSHDSVFLRLSYITYFPEKIWEFPQKKYPAMPVFLLKFIF